MHSVCILKGSPFINFAQEVENKIDEITRKLNPDEVKTTWLITSDPFMLICIIESWD